MGSQSTVSNAGSVHIVPTPLKEHVAEQHGNIVSKKSDRECCCDRNVVESESIDES